VIFYTRELFKNHKQKEETNECARLNTGMHTMMHMHVSHLMMGADLERRDEAGRMGRNGDEHSCKQRRGEPWNRTSSTDWAYPAQD